MHALLAISGFHFCYINPEQRQSYTVTSTRHQTLALELFSSRLPDVNAENCQACILFASFIFIISTYSIAGLHTTEEPIPMSDVVQSFLLMQGMVHPTPHQSANQEGYEHAKAPHRREHDILRPIHVANSERRSSGASSGHSDAGSRGNRAVCRTARRAHRSRADLPEFFGSDQRHQSPVGVLRRHRDAQVNLCYDVGG